MRKEYGIQFIPGNVTYRSYTDGRTWDDISSNSTLEDVRKCSIHSLVYEINEVYAVFKQNSDDYELTDVDILGIQNQLLSGDYHLSPLRLVCGYDAFPRKNSTFKFSLEIDSS